MKKKIVKILMLIFFSILARKVSFCKSYDFSIIVTFFFCFFFNFLYLQFLWWYFFFQILDFLTFWIFWNFFFNVFEFYRYVQFQFNFTFDFLKVNIWRWSFGDVGFWFCRLLLQVLSTIKISVVSQGKVCPELG